MRARTKWAAGVLAVLGSVVLVRRSGTANRHQFDVLARRLRYLGGRLNGVSYRLHRRRPNHDVSDLVLADRIRSSLGPLEKRLDLPHIHVMVEDHVALLHGDVGSEADAERIEAAVAAMTGVVGVESYLHVSLTAGDSRPSAGRSVDQPSDARRRLLEAATSEGLDDRVAAAAVRAILATFAERLPNDERDHVAAHLPPDVRSMLVPPRRVRQRRVRTVPELIVRIIAANPEIPHQKASDVIDAVIRELRALVPEEVADIAAVLPAELREWWERAPREAP